MQQSIAIVEEEEQSTGKLAYYSLKAAQFFTLLLPLLIFTGKAPVDIACSLVAVLFFLTHILRKDFSWTRPLWVRCILFFWGYLILRSCFADDPLLALDRAAPWVRYPFFAIALSHWVITDRAFSRKLLISMCVSCAALSLDALWQFVTGTDILGHSKVAADRLTGPYRQPRIGYTIAWIALPVLTCCLDFRRDRLMPSLLKLGAAAGLCLAIIASGERTPALLMLLGLVLAGVMIPAIRRRLFWGIPLAAAGIAAFLYLNPVIYERQVVSTTQTVAHFWETPYGKIALDAGDIIAENPLFGIGVQHYRIATAIDSDARERGHSHPHNFYLEVWAEAGLIGLALLVATFGCWIWRFVRHFPLWQGDFLVTGLVIGILVRLWPVISTPSFYASWNVIPLWLMVGWYFALMRGKESA